MCFANSREYSKPLFQELRIMLKTMESHLENLSANFKPYFFVENDINLTDWSKILISFANQPVGLSLQDEEQLIYVSRTPQKSKFANKSLTIFWSEYPNDCCIKKTKALKIMD